MSSKRCIKQDKWKNRLLVCFVNIYMAMTYYRNYAVKLLNLQPPKAPDRMQVQAKEVRLPDSPPISLDDQDMQIVSYCRP